MKTVYLSINFSLDVDDSFDEQEFTVKLNPGEIEVLTQNGSISTSTFSTELHDVDRDEDAPYWGEESPHHYFTYQDWQDTVRQGDTNSGYTDWVENQLEQTRNELAELLDLLEQEMQGGAAPEEVEHIHNEIDGKKAALSDQSEENQTSDEPFQGDLPGVYA